MCAVSVSFRDFRQDHFDGFSSAVAIVAVALAFTCAWAPAGASAADKSADESECTVKANQWVEGDGTSRTIHLKVDSPAETVDISGKKFVAHDMSLALDPKAPSSLDGRQFSFSVLRRWRVNDERMLPFPTFTPVTIDRGRDALSFQVCVDATNAKPGTYTGALTVRGPAKVQPASVGFSVTVKWGGLVFWLLFSLVLLVTLIVLLALYWEQLQAAKKFSKFWVAAQIAFLLIIAACAMLKVYDADPDWGANKVVDLGTMAAAGFAMIGVKSTKDITAAFSSRARERRAERR